jgi:hypothetical protein
MKKIFGQDIKTSTKRRIEKRSGIERRQFLYNGHIPERRSGKDRRSEKQRKLKSRIRNSEKDLDKQI